MSKAIYTGVGGIARKVPKLYVGVNGVTRKVKKGYIGVNGVARLFYDGDADNPTLPSAYQLLEYIDFSSGTYGAIDSGLSAEYTYIINVTAQPLVSSGVYPVGWQYRTTTTNISYVSILINAGNNTVAFGRGYTGNSSSHTIVVPNASKPMEIEFNREANTVSVDNITESFTAKSTNASGDSVKTNLYIGGYHLFVASGIGADIYTYSVRIYKCMIQLYSGSSAQKHYFYPCKEKATGRVGLYDTTAGVFVGNDEVIAGPAIV